jgi:hypothetical protein
MCLHRLFSCGVSVRQTGQWQCLYYQPLFSLTSGRRQPQFHKSPERNRRFKEFRRFLAGRERHIGGG